jgi:hypothetical protein
MARAYKALPPASELWERFEYKPLTGELVLRKRCGNRRAGSAVGSLTKNGYLQTSICKQQVYVHRLVFAWCKGEEPCLDIDHKDRIKTNNRIWNLRPATRTQNGWNRAARGTSKVGNRWYARLSLGNREVYHIPGGFSTEAEAHAAYEKASQELHGEFSSVE